MSLPALRSRACLSRCQRAHDEGITAGCTSACSRAVPAIPDSSPFHEQLAASITASGVPVTTEQVVAVDRARRTSSRPPFGVVGLFIENVLRDEEGQSHV